MYTYHINVDFGSLENVSYCLNCFKPSGVFPVANSNQYRLPEITKYNNGKLIYNNELAPLYSNF